ncbi:MAG: LysR family transcriptional regulator [Spirochaetia bacterium]|jgi:DNA-binding transcriptional LysR family regulator|nr:LysR family transcriptional regulator [Spirochaetia bacterium]
MSLSSLQLDAFLAAAKSLNFSRAAESLFITQSALSQRVKNLELTMGATLFIREPSQVKITEIGEKLLSYCQTKDTMEDELLLNLTSKDRNELAGIVKIGAFSSVLRSVVIPSMSSLLRKNSKVQCDFIHEETPVLPTLLDRSECDFIILDYPMNSPAIEKHLLGYEEYIVIESQDYTCPNYIYLDNSPGDTATEHFFNAQEGSTPKYDRRFMGETYGIIAGVESGLGRSVMPLHLLTDRPHLKKVEGFNLYKREITLHYKKQSYYSELHKQVIIQLSDK